ncbi:GDSL-type esterase/lipase family protein [Streptomyces atroolivaceus]|uniref:GDSL-type esterase/lipase family protein n=1 Tax=Streptomyces atroolivaceus TaxID=66869 RepID=A0ABV9VFC7_STRAZ|nr:GDSL-type esterase/lipase family protein [Streptomyces atroolivaceus]
MSTFANTLDSNNWVATWAGPVARHPAAMEPIAQKTLRLRIEASVGGRAVRVVLTNEYGTSPLRIGAASIATVDQDGDEGQPAPLTFGGQSSIDVAVGAVALSNDVELSVDPGQHLFVKLYLPVETKPESAVLVQGPELPLSHPLAVALPDFERVELSSEGDFTDVTGLPGATPGVHLPFLSRVDVLALADVSTVAVLGTTYTDGLDVWPDHLSRLWNTEPGQERFSIVNLSARGGSMSRGHAPSGREGVVTLFDREVLSLPGISHVIVSEARQDITTAGARSLNADGSRSESSDGEELPVTAESLKAAYRQLIAKAHVRGVKVLAATMPPFRGVPAPGYYSDEKDDLREEINAWILESGEFDGVIDIDALMRDPEDTRQYREQYRSANFYGPNPQGHAAIAASIDPAVLQ